MNESFLITLIFGSKNLMIPQSYHTLFQNKSVTTVDGRDTLQQNPTYTLSCRTTLALEPRVFFSVYANKMTSMSISYWDRKIKNSWVFHRYLALTKSSEKQYTSSLVCKKIFCTKMMFLKKLNFWIFQLKNFFRWRIAYSAIEWKFTTTYLTTFNFCQIRIITARVLDVDPECRVRNILGTG